MKWNLIARLEKNGHRLFREEPSGRYALADNSGSTPDQTEDGELYLREGFVVLTVSQPGSGDVSGASVPLIDYKGRECWTVVGWDGASKLVELLPDKFRLEAITREGRRFSLVPIPAEEAKVAS